MISADMNRSRLPIALSVLAVAAALVVHHIFAKQAARRREAYYESVLRVYTTDLKPGMARTRVEGYLHDRQVRFRQMCCVDLKDFDKGIWDDMAKIGMEDVPWFCRENNVYVAFQFTPCAHGPL